MKRFMVLALGASALAVAACVPQGQGPGYGHNPPVKGMAERQLAGRRYLGVPINPRSG